MLCLCSYDFSHSKQKKRWIKNFKHTGYTLKLVFSLHRMTRRVKREDRNILSRLGKEIFNDNNKRDFSFMLGIRQMGCWWKQLQLVLFSRQNYILKDHFQLIWLLCSLNFMNWLVIGPCCQWKNLQVLNMTFLRRLLSSSPLLVDLQRVIIDLTSLVTCPIFNYNLQPHLYLFFIYWYMIGHNSLSSAYASE